MSAPVNVERELGGIEARQDAADVRLKSIEDKLDTLVKQLAVAQGGLRMLISVGAVCAGIGAAVAKILEIMHGHP